MWQVLTPVLTAISIDLRDAQAMPIHNVLKG